MVFICDKIISPFIIDKIFVYKYFLVIEGHFTYGRSQYCNKQVAELYTSVIEAKVACLDEKNCKMIFSKECDGNNWKLCKGELKSSSSGSCTWTKGNAKEYGILVFPPYSKFKLVLYLN